MTGVPDVSVVMSVYNGAATLRATLDSVLGQKDCGFEFIVIDDGSTDAVPAILHEYAACDSRLRVVRQPNAGLTRALIRGCEMATGEFIARQDAGDLSLAGRLATQTAFLRARPGVVMTACGVRFVGPLSERLYEIRRPTVELENGLKRLSLSTICGPPHHGATMFRRDAYTNAGGYRAPFVVAQDLDLWLRLIERGQCLGTDGVLYEARLEAGSISSRRREEQLRMAQSALDCRLARLSVGDDGPALACTAPPEKDRGRLTRSERARFNYFVASCIRKHDRAAARRYYNAALRDNPLHLKALVHLAFTQ